MVRGRPELVCGWQVEVTDGSSDMVLSFLYCVCSAVALSAVKVFTLRAVHNGTSLLAKCAETAEHIGGLIDP